jgi:hypothetical protein
VVTKRKLHGVRIPNWTTILEMAVNTQIASGLGYCGVDIILHPTRGPMVLELNAQPGLQIQMANVAGLQRRLMRVDELNVGSVEQGVKIGKALFGEQHLFGVKSKEGDTQIGVWEKVKLLGYKQRLTINAKIDTGAWRTSIDKKLADDLHLLSPSNILWSRKVRTTKGVDDRPVIYLRFYLGGKLIKTYASVTSRAHMRVPMIIGRRDLAGFVVKSDAGTQLPGRWRGK